MDATKGLVVLPFSGWSYDSADLQQRPAAHRVHRLVDRAPRGAAHTRGWVERGIFVENRLVSLCDLSLAVVDYTNHDAPIGDHRADAGAQRHHRAARRARPSPRSRATGGTTTSPGPRCALLPIAQRRGDHRRRATSRRVQRRRRQRAVFMNGNLAYVVTNVRVPAACDSYGPADRQAPTRQRRQPCYGARRAGAGRRSVERRRVCAARSSCRSIPGAGGAGAGGAASGTTGAAAPRWCRSAATRSPSVAGSRSTTRPTATTSTRNSSLWVVDLANPDAPATASVTITDDPDGWWGNMQVVGDTLYTGHYEWVDRPTDGGNYSDWTVRYYADRIDSDRSRAPAHRRQDQRARPPGRRLGRAIPSLLYTIDYRWDANIAKNDFDVVRVARQPGRSCSRRRRSTAGSGSTFVRGDAPTCRRSSTSTRNGGYAARRVQLHAIDLSEPVGAGRPGVAASAKGWGWLLDVEGDRAVVTSGWGAERRRHLSARRRTARRSSASSRARSAGGRTASRARTTRCYLSSGYWGVQKIDLQ